MNLITRLSRSIIGSLELVFMRWGKFVCTYPYLVICTSAIITAICSLGLITFKMEHKANLLWIPANSSYNNNKDWLDTNFKKTIRNEMMIMKGENVLTPKAIQKMYRIYQTVNAITVNGNTFEELCTRVPIADIFQAKRRRKRQVTHYPLILDEDITISVSDDEDHDDDYSYDESYGIWDDAYYDNEPIATTKERINFVKYGKKSVKTVSSSDTLDNIPKSIYCDLVTTLSEKCVTHSLLEIWRFSEDLISSVTTQEILDAVNWVETSPWFGHQADFSQLLGGIKRNSTGQIVSAEAARMFWSIRVPEDAQIVESQGSGVELELGDANSLAWEDEFVRVIKQEGSESSDGLEIFPNAVNSYGEVSSKAIFFDGTLMAGGYFLMFIYTAMMLGQLNCVEVRMFLAIAGISSILMGLVIAVGLSSLLGFPYTPMHAILPFLCLGIGIDDMFVIVQCLRNQKPISGQQPPVADLLGAALKHAGVSITVTSVTDVLAFGVGAVTAMPGLQSFCVCTAIGLASIYLLQIGWFVACLSIDEERIREAKNGLVPCIQHNIRAESEAEQSDKKTFRKMLLSWYRELLNLKAYRVVIMVTSLGCLAFGVWGTSLIRYKFDPFLLLPSSSYLSQFISVNDQYYNPYRGWTAEVYTGYIDHNDLAKIDHLVSQLEILKQEELFLQDYHSWWTHFKAYTHDKTNFSSWKNLSNPEDFPLVFSDFMFSSYGSKFKINFKFDGELLCNSPAPPILASKFDIEYFPFDGPEDHVPAKDMVDRLIDKSGLQDAFTFVKIYAAWETDKIIGFELWRNVALAITCVFIITLILLANLKICLMVLGIVVVTLIDIIGFLHFWNMTIDIISCINIVIAIGLCVDYSVHIGHAYMIAKGSRQQKAMQSVETIGPAVLNGGITTFLALMLLGASTSHTFLTFFKVFVLTVVFGLFHGLFLFPVILSVIGPVEQQDRDLDCESVASRGTNISDDTEGTSSGDDNRGLDNRSFQAEVLKHNVMDQTWTVPVAGFGKRGSWSPCSGVV